MRQITFRGKRVSDGVWVYGSLICSEDLSKENASAFIQIMGGQIISEVVVRVDPNTVGQYVGINRLDQIIYEGDIVAAQFRTGHGGKSTKSKTINCAVIYHNERFLYKWPESVGRYRFGSSLTSLEIIGNIHDTPELLSQL